MSRRAGFTLVELLIAGTLALLLIAGLLAVIDPQRSASRDLAAAIDIRQRLRAAAEALSADVLAAGGGPVNGVFGRAIGSIAPAVLPYRLGPRGDPPGTARPDALSLITAAAGGAAVELSAPFVPGVGTAEIVVNTACPVGDPSCGLAPGVAVLLLDGGGQSDLFRVAAVAGQLIGLEPRGPTSGRVFPAGSLIVPVVVSTYVLRAGTTADGAQLISGDGDQTDLPLIDHLAGLTIELLGEPRPPRLAAAAAMPPAVTYGPRPPRLGTDDDRDEWPAGENCTILVSGGEQQSRLPTLQGGTALVHLAAVSLTDGPWCPDASAPNRLDADLLRVRAVRVTIRAEATSGAARGTDARLFTHPGTSRALSGVAADRQVVFDVVPRALQSGR